MHSLSVFDGKSGFRAGIVDFVPKGLPEATAAVYTERNKQGREARNMYRIAVLAKNEAQENFYSNQISCFCMKKGLFPRIDHYLNPEWFFEAAQKAPPTNAIISLPGIDGLNAAEHLRALCPETRIIWCSELDFSLHAFRLRVDYFLLEPVPAEAFQQGLSVWFEENMPSAHSRQTASNHKEDFL